MITDAKKLKYLLQWRSEKHKDNGGIQCPICNYYFEGLGSHVFYAHGITAREFRIKYDMNMGDKLTSENLHKFFVHKSTTKKALKALKKNSKKINYNNRRKSYMSNKERMKRSKMFSCPKSDEHKKRISEGLLRFNANRRDK